jgi:hypothetical protein
LIVFETKLAGVPQDELAVARLMAVELKTRLVRDQWLKQRLALDQRLREDIPTIKVQEIEGVVDEPHIALAVSGRLCIREARQSSLIHATQFAIDVGSLHVQIRQRGNGVRIFCPSSPGQSASGAAHGRYRSALPCDSRRA